MRAVVPVTSAGITFVVGMGGRRGLIDIIFNDLATNGGNSTFGPLIAAGGSAGGNVSCSSGSDGVGGNPGTGSIGSNGNGIVRTGGYGSSGSFEGIGGRAPRGSVELGDVGWPAPANGGDQNQYGGAGRAILTW